MKQTAEEKERMAREEIATMDRLIATEHKKLQKMRDSEVNPVKMKDQAWYVKALENSVAGMRKDLAESALNRQPGPSSRRHR